MTVYAPPRGDEVPMTPAQRVARKYAGILVQKVSDSDGSYMTVANLRGLSEHAEELLEIIGSDTILPDWVESKIDRAAAGLLDVYEYLMHGEGE